MSTFPWIVVYTGKPCCYSSVLNDVHPSSTVTAVYYFKSALPQLVWHQITSWQPFLDYEGDVLHGVSHSLNKMTVNYKISPLPWWLWQCTTSWPTFADSYGSALHHVHPCWHSCAMHYSHPFPTSTAVHNITSIPFHRCSSVFRHHPSFLHWYGSVLHNVCPSLWQCITPCQNFPNRSSNGLHQVNPSPTFPAM